MMTMPTFSPVPDVSEWCGTSRIVATPGIFPSAAPTSASTFSVRASDAPGGSATSAITVPLSSSGRNPPGTRVNTHTSNATIAAKAMSVNHIQRMRNPETRSYTRRSQRMPQSNAASGAVTTFMKPVGSFGSLRMSAATAGESVSAHTVERQSATHIVTENCR